MGPKYEFTGETKNWYDRTLHRIRRLSDGKLGGWIEKESNLSQEGNCWVDGDAKVFEDARVSDNAQVCDNASVRWRAKIFGDAKIYNSAYISDSVQVCYNAQVYGNAQLRGCTRIDSNAEIYGNARVDGDAQVYGNAQVYDNAEVSYDAKVFGNAEVYGFAKVYGSAWIYGDTKVYGDAYVNGDTEICGTAKVDYDVKSGCIGKSEKDNYIQPIKDFIYKIDDSSKLEVQSNYDSIDEFFDDTSDDSYTEHENITILAIDTKTPLIKLEKTQFKDENVIKFIVDITNEDGDNYSVKSIIDSEEKFNQLLQSTIDALKCYPQFNKYVDDLETCL